MITKVKLLLACFLGFSALASSQTDTLEVTLNQALAYATEFGYQSINAHTDIEIARKKVRETLAIGLPQISASGALIKNVELAVIEAEINGEKLRFKQGVPYNTSLGGRVDQLLFNGSYLVGLQASKVYVRLSEDAKDKTEIEIKQAVSEAYFLTLIARRNINEFEDGLKTSQKTLTQTEEYFKNGLLEDIDVDQVRLITKESERLYLNAKNQYNIALSVLKFTIGYDIDKPLKLAENMDDLLATIPINPDFNTDIQSHIDYRMLSTQIDIKGLDIKNQKSQALPVLNAFANYDYSEFGYELSDMIDTKAAAIGLSLSLPIFSSGMRSAQLKQKKLELSKLNVERKMLEQSLRQDVLIAKSNLTNAKDQFQNTKDAQEIAKRIYKKSLIKFENGMLNSIELSQIQSNMIEAIVTYYGASNNYFNMYLQYKKASSQL